MTNNYNVNFQGGFWIKKPSTRMWNTIKETLCKRNKANERKSKVVFENFNEEGDKFFAIKNCHDKEIGEFLLSKQTLDFAFYPDINLKCGLDSYYPEEAKKIINSQARVIRCRKAIRTFINGLKTRFITPQKYKWKPNDFIAQTLSALKLNIKDCKISLKNGKALIQDKSGKKTLAIASPNSHNGYNYVYALPQNAEGEAKRYAVDQFGSIKHTFSIDEAETFKKYFDRSVKQDHGRWHPDIKN